MQPMARAGRKRALVGGRRVLVVVLGVQGTLGSTAGAPFPNMCPSWTVSPALAQDASSVGELWCIASNVKCLCPEGHCVPWDPMGDVNLPVLGQCTLLALVHCLTAPRVPAARHDIYSGAPAPSLQP